jgi:hypothetical protein
MVNIETKNEELLYLKIVISQLLKNKDALENEILELRNIKENLEEHVDKLKKVIPKLKCIHPPYILSEIIGISSYKIVKIAESLKLFDDNDACIRIPRVNKQPSEKYETIVLFSEYGIIQIFEALNMGINNNNYNDKITNLNKSDIEKVSPFFLNYDFDKKEFISMNDSSLKKIWDTKEEDEAWNHL